MLIIGDNIFGICSNCTILKLIIIHIRFNQSKVIVSIMINRRTQFYYCLNNIM